MGERVDHAIGQALHIGAEFSTFVELPGASHDLRPIVIGGRGAHGLIRQLKIARQTHGVRALAASAALAGDWPASAATRLGGFQLDVRMFNLHGVQSVHSYMANRHHICNL